MHFEKVYQGFEFPDNLKEMIEANASLDLCPTVNYRHLLPNPFMILIDLSKGKTNEGPEFWRAVMAKYKEEEHDPDQVSEIDILILLSKYGN